MCSVIFLFYRSYSGADQPNRRLSGRDTHVCLTDESRTTVARDRAARRCIRVFSRGWDNGRARDGLNRRRHRGPALCQMGDRASKQVCSARLRGDADVRIVPHELAPRSASEGRREARSPVLCAYSDRLSDWCGRKSAVDRNRGLRSYPRRQRLASSRVEASSSSIGNRLGVRFAPLKTNALI